MRFVRSHLFVCVKLCGKWWYCIFHLLGWFSSFVLISSSLFLFISRIVSSISQLFYNLIGEQLFYERFARIKRAHKIFIWNTQEEREVSGDQGRYVHKLCVYVCMYIQYFLFVSNFIGVEFVMVAARHLPFVFLTLSFCCCCCLFIYYST